MSTNKVVNNISSLNQDAIEIISENQWLEDTHIDYFGLLLKNCSEYKPRETWRIQYPDTIKPVNKDEKHIQILHSCDNIATNKSGHWVCSYYNSKRIYIYDSLNLKRLHVHHKIYLEKLYPFYPFDKKPIHFPTCLLQPNSDDCGVFAIAFAVSLLFGLQPDKVKYNHDLMRPHLIQMFKLNKIEHFPRIIRPNDPKELFTLERIKKKTALAKKKRERRQKKNKQDQCINIINNNHNITNKNDDFDYIEGEKLKINEKYINKLNNNRESTPIYVNPCITNVNINKRSMNEVPKYANTVRDIVPLSEHDIRKVIKGEWLEDIHIDHFGLLMKFYSQYQPRDSWKIQCPDRIEPVSKTQKHIQILHSCSDMTTNLDGHWVCSYYDTKMIYIYDSLNLKRLHEHHKIYLEKLYPFYSFTKQPVLFPTVQRQPNGNDCGVFSIAFAVSLLFGVCPDKIIYNQSLMRQHLAHMFEINVIQQFPKVIIQPINYKQLIQKDAFEDSTKYMKTVTAVENSDRDKYDIKRKLSPVYVNSNKKQKTRNTDKSAANTVTAIKDSDRDITGIKRKLSPIYMDNNKKYKTRNKNKSDINKNYYKEHKDYILTKKRNYYKDNLYHENKSIINKKYYKLHRDDLLTKSNIYYQTRRNKIRKELINDFNTPKDDTLQTGKMMHKVQTTETVIKHKRCYDVNKRNMSTYKRKNQVVAKIKKKYNCITLINNNVKMKYSKEKYIENISKLLGIPSLSESRMEAERIVKWCFYIREHYILQMKILLKKLKQKIEICLTRAEECSPSEHENYINLFFGQSKHTVSSESYFAESTYHTLNSSESIIMNSEGKAINILPITLKKGSKKAWYCSTLCKIENIIINDLKCFFQELLNCTLNNLHKFIYRFHKCYNRVHQDKLGHSHGCYINYKICRSRFLAIEIVSPHYPIIRYIRKLLYNLINIDNKLNKLDKALNDVDINTLQDITNEVQQNAKVFTKHTEINLNEDKIQSHYYLAFKALMKRSMDTPKYACISCTKYCFERDIITIKINNRVDMTTWSMFVSDIALKVNENYIICKYCHRYFKNNKMPPTCRCNNLEVLPIPEEITTLNDYERILIQRAKAFQTVQKMGTVINKNLPHKHMVSKVKGRTFHLPLPLEETLKKICPSTQPINLNHELYILVRGIPTKANMVWEKLVDVKKVWNALMWLKHNNPIYSDIVLPTSADNLLHSELQDVEFQEDDHDIYDTMLEKENKILEKEILRGNFSIKDEQEHKALLTQMSQSDKYYEQFTIYPMHEKRINESATTLYQMIKIQDTPLDNRNKDLDVKCFPDLYPYGVNGQHQNRNIKLTDFEYIKVRLMSQHMQFRLNIQYLFYLLYNSNMRQLNSGIFHKMNVINPREKYTAASYLKQLSNQELESNLSTIFSKLRNTEQYWRIPRSNLHCMIYHYGPATWFLTLSPCEWLWTDLIEYLRDVNGSFAENKSANELIALDPVSTSRFIDNKFKAMLDFICSSDDPIGKVTHYFWRREYQSRGMQHFHLLIWIDGAPIIGKSSNEEIASFILKYVTCRMPQKKVSPQLYRRVNTHQRHKHNNYCLRTKKSKIGFSKVCRFGFSRPITNTIMIRDVTVSIANRRKLKTKSRLYDLPRSQEEININDYNPTILTAWEGNMDIQFVGEKSTLLTWYTTKYISKAEKSNETDILQKINSTKSLRSCLWNIGMRMLNHRECGALEAADTLLGIPLHGTDSKTTMRWLDVNIIRNRKLKSRKEIEMLNKDSTDIFCSSIIDTYYPSRPEELKSTNLYDYAKWYDITKTKPCSKIVEYYVLGECLYLKRRKYEYLINHYKYNVHTQPERYYFSLLLLFKPWRDISELKNKCDSYAEAFSLIQFQLKDALKYHEKLIDIQQGIDNVKELIEKRMLENTKDEEDNFDNCALECVPIQVEGAMKDFKDAGNKFEIDNVDEMITQLNADQKRIFDRVTATVTSNSEILRLYVSGEGGTGKSFLIKTIKCWIKKYIEKDTAVTAPTGIAAFNIDGLTIHRLFQLPVEHGHTAKYNLLSDVVLKTVRDELKKVTLIIIDEISMVSNITLMYIHLRLTEIFNTSDCDNGWFGKKHILLFGDLLQLPPVHEEPSFIELSTVKIEKYIGAMGSTNLWFLFSYDELQINMRQQSDNTYRDILSRIRIGTVTESDTVILESRKVKFKATTCEGRLQHLCNYLQGLPVDAVCLLPTCSLCDTLNSAMLNRISGDEIELVAQDVMDCATYLRKKVSKILNKDDEDSSRTAGLARIIKVKLGTRIMIRRNIDLTLGLVNGTIGTITSVIRGTNNKEIEKIKIMLSSGIEHMIERLSVKFQVMDRAFVMRKQFPICLSYGITIHKSQGLSLKHAVVEAGSSVFSCGQIYVALSRVTTLSGLHLINFDPSSVKANELAIIEYNRLRQQYRPDILNINVNKLRYRKVCDITWAISEKVLKCQVNDNNNDLINLWNIQGLQNDDNVSCYANASIQCIFHSSILRKILLRLEHTNIMKKFIDCYISNNKALDTTSIRILAGDQYLPNIKQDASQFITDLINNIDSVKNSIEHQLCITTRCKICSYTNIDIQPNYILLLKLPENLKKSYTLQELIEYNFTHWNNSEKLCTNCGKNSTIEKKEIIITKDIFIFKLWLFKTANNKITNLNIKSVPTVKIRIGKDTYKIISAIFHHGTSITNGHCISIVRVKHSEWISINDSKIHKCSWPRNAKNAYMFFAEKM